MTTFEKLKGIDVKDHVEKKGKFDYLSWPHAVNYLLEQCPEATWEVKKADDGKPYIITPAGPFVEVSVTVDGVTRTQIHPVLDSRNAVIHEPNAFDINTSIQRCLVKAIALHGLGLSVYAGEDLPNDGATKPAAKKPAPKPAAKPEALPKKPEEATPGKAPKGTKWYNDIVSECKDCNKPIVEGDWALHQFSSGQSKCKDCALGKTPAEATKAAAEKPQGEGVPPDSDCPF